MKRSFDNYPCFQMGTSLLLVILTTICLIVFSALSLSAALRDLSYSEKIAEKTSTYYDANSKAYQKLKSLVDEGATGVHSYEIEITKDRMLSVTVELTDDSYHIITWKEVSSATWENNDTLPVLGSGQED